MAFVVNIAGILTVVSLLTRYVVQQPARRPDHAQAVAEMARSRRGRRPTGASATALSSPRRPSGSQLRLEGLRIGDRLAAGELFADEGRGVAVQRRPPLQERNR